jgi:hypothetical protein
MREYQIGDSEGDQQTHLRPVQSMQIGRLTLARPGQCLPAGAANSGGHTGVLEPAGARAQRAWLLNSATHLGHGQCLLITAQMRSVELASFSKSWLMHEACLKVFLHRYNLDRVAILL